MISPAYIRKLGIWLENYVDDINFPITCRLIRERQYLEKIKESLPQTGKIQKVFETVKSYLEKNAGKLNRAADERR
jgi:hypothetical protein